ncbi:MAG: glutaredoxin family protein [Chloroflexi bacterium]|nr:glutaredoxin family protein [Chloroflexota bacterium]
MAATEQEDNPLTADANTVKMFTTTWCGFCKGTKRYLDSKGVAYEEIDIEQHPEYGEQIEKETGGFRTVPTLEIDGKLYVNPSRKQLDELLHV